MVLAFCDDQVTVVEGHGLYLNKAIVWSELRKGNISLEFQGIETLLGSENILISRFWDRHCESRSTTSEKTLLRSNAVGYW